MSWSVFTLDWATLLVAAPMIGSLPAVLLPRRAHVVGLVTAALTALLALGNLANVWVTGPRRLALGDMDAPLAVSWVLDGLSTLMLVMTAVVGLAVSLYAFHFFRPGLERVKFWALWLWLWASLNALYLSGNTFNLFVAVELIVLTSLGLVGLAGGIATSTAAVRYLLVDQLGSLAYLAGVALLYAAYGSLDLTLLGELVRPGPYTWLAAALMIAGLCLKTALFPLHVWLPPAHAGAPAPVSAVLSALVVKASFYIALRLWGGVFASVAAPALGHLIGALGVAAVLWGSLQALRTESLKHLVAYSTVAQLGYLYVVFPLMTVNPEAWRVAVFFVLAHALAKAAVFLAAGSLQRAAGHDRLSDLGPTLRGRPLAAFAIGIAGASLIGLPLTGGFVAKFLLLEAAILVQGWAWALFVLAGGLLAGGYIFRILGRAFIEGPRDRGVGVSPLMEWSALALALLASAMALLSVPIMDLLDLTGGFL